MSRAVMTEKRTTPSYHNSIFTKNRMPITPAAASSAMVYAAGMKEVCLITAIRFESRSILISSVRSLTRIGPATFASAS